MSPFGRGAVTLSIVAVLGCGAPARAQDLDRNKSATKLFASNCVTCHRSPRGLAKGRISWSLSNYLQQHYTSSPESAQALTAYLQSVDTPPAKPRAASGSKRGRPQPQTQTTRASVADPAVPRPPASVPRR
jgi:mono/diheme cytochrome c family protein